MRVLVSEHYTGRERHFTGSEEEVRKAVLWAYPFLFRRCTQITPLNEVLGILNDHQTHSVYTAHETMEKSLEEAEPAIHTLTNITHDRHYDHDALLDAHPSSIQPAVNHFERTINRSAEEVRPLRVWKPVNEVKERPEGGGVEGKALVRHGNRSYLIKAGAFMFRSRPRMGALAELASQAIYHAAGIGHLHQKVHASYHHGYSPELKRDIKVPITVIHMEPDAVMASSMSAPSAEVRKPFVDDYDKITCIDTVLGNFDRHGENILIRPNGQPLAIDNGMAFSNVLKHVSDYQHGFARSIRLNPVVGRVGLRPVVSQHVHDWWKQNRDIIERTAREFVGLHLNSVDEERAHETITKGLQAVDAWLEMHRQHVPGLTNREFEPADPLQEKTDTMTDRDEPQVEAQQGEEVKKALKGVEHHINFPMNATNLAASYLFDTEAAKKHHPEAIQPHVDYFEKHLNGENEVEPIKLVSPIYRTPVLGGREEGVEGKGFFKHGGRNFLVKGAAINFNERELSTGWAELASQAAYHAGGIGHLHQKVHLSSHPSTFPGDDTFPMTVIHMEDGRLSRDRDSAPRSVRFQHIDDYDKINLMDKLLGNFDRHAGNLLIRPNGQPLAIDNGLSFRSDPKMIPNRNHGDEDIYDTAIERRAVSKKVHDWWYANKDSMMASIEKSVNLIKSPAERARIKWLVQEGQRVVEEFLEKHAQRRNELYRHLPPEER